MVTRMLLVLADLKRAQPIVLYRAIVASYVTKHRLYAQIKMSMLSFSQISNYCHLRNDW